MLILVFTEGTLLAHREWAGLSRTEAVSAVRERLEPLDYTGSVPVGNAVDKLHTWARQGAQIAYLTSRTDAREISIIGDILQNFGFPAGEVYFRRKGETYADIAGRLQPDVLIEDDCESIGGEAEMTYPHIQPQLKARIKSIVVPEFGGIDHLPDKLTGLYDM